MIEFIQALNKTFISIGLLLLALTHNGCDHKVGSLMESNKRNNELLNRINHRLTEATIAGTLSPPAAARCFAYANIAAFEATAIKQNKYNGFSGRLNGYGVPDLDVDTSNYVVELAVIHAFCSLAREGVFHPQLIDELSAHFTDSISSLYGNHKVEYTMEICRKLEEHLLKWMRADGFAEMRALPRYVTINEPWAWEPTPPKYSEALDPWWHKIRSFVLDSPSVYRPDFRVTFSADSSSEFYNYAKEVQQTVETLTLEQREIANFWDCNPYLTKRDGHAIRAVRQMSPGAHWIGLVRNACTVQNLDLHESSFRTAITAIALHDGFISVWDTKYHYQLIRPETYINRYIDPKWRPLLETPHFPDYTSGHSAISAAASTVLTEFFGNNYAFTDSLEVPFGKTPRSFGSFKEASDEVANSRLYGGIHYRFSNDDGIAQGKKIGQHVLKRLVAAE
ncbi:MAG: vanadium-dependent haloperoxidase [Flavobacteriales bacterium]|nr:vanadium-dependent haloperoxidase [Flavobacteriales bacterium]